MDSQNTQPEQPPVPPQSFPTTPIQLDTFMKVIVSLMAGVFVLVGIGVVRFMMTPQQSLTLEQSEGNIDSQESQQTIISPTGEADTREKAEGTLPERATFDEVIDRLCTYLPGGGYDVPTLNPEELRQELGIDIQHENFIAASCNLMGGNAYFRFENPYVPDEPIDAYLYGDAYARESTIQDRSALDDVIITGAVIDRGHPQPFQIGQQVDSVGIVTGGLYGKRIVNFTSADGYDYNLRATMDVFTGTEQPFIDFLYAHGNATEVEHFTGDFSYYMSLPLEDDQKELFYETFEQTFTQPYKGAEAPQTYLENVLRSIPLD